MQGTSRDWKGGAHWLVLVLTLGLAALTARLVDLKPQVDENFFFSSDDPQLKQSKESESLFQAKPQLILSVASSNISAPQYVDRIRSLTDEIKLLGAVDKVKSLTDGPKSPADALTNPFWRRLLIAPKHDSSNLILLLKTKDSQELIRQLEAIVKEFDGPDFRVRLAGVPYVVEMIRRSLVHDLLWFSITAVVLFGVMMEVIFRSWRLFLGMLATCTNAVLLTLLVQALFGKKIGILTVNLGTIIFVVTLSHLVYLTFNWQTLAGRAGKKSTELAFQAARMTFPASFWSMVCSALGFGSLLIAQTKPLRELGFGGVLGTAIGLGCAYAMYPWYLCWAVPRKNKLPGHGDTSKFWSHRFVVPSIAVVVVSAGLGVGLTRLNTDPNLLDYFRPHQKLREALEYVDQNGGSNPLVLVVSNPDGTPMDSAADYKKLRSLQHALENHPDVGTAISLPVLIAAARRVPFADFLSNESLLRIMDEPEHGRITSKFVTPDRQQAMFFLRMIETKRREPHLKIVAGLKSIVRDQGFEIGLVGGIYELQGELSKQVASSLVTDLFWLNVLFIVIAWIVARSIRGAVAMMVCLMLVPLCMLGGVGLFHVPVDIISAPATNICIGMAVDSMIHLMFGVRRNQHGGKMSWKAWVAGRDEQWRGIVYSDVIIAAGFAIFALSSFPPTQRFGLVVVLGTAVDILANLFVLPLLGGASWSNTRH